MKKQDLKNLIAYALENGGATINGNGKIVSFPFGYQVAIREYEKKIPLSSVDNIALETINNYLLVAKKARAFVGLWLDNETLYLDISNHIQNKGVALSIGRKEKQLSIFDWGALDCIAC